MFESQQNLFEAREALRKPLAERMRPTRLQDLVGQEHLVADDSSFLHWIQQGGLGNVLLYGPPGCGKTSLAQLMARELGRHLIVINAVLSNLGELRASLKQAEQSGGASILFIDEIHRFNRSQQDALLPFCETGKVQLIGATTRHPSLYLIPPLISRCYLFELKPLAITQVYKVLEAALKDVDNGLGALRIEANEAAVQCIAKATHGDLRRALNLLEYLCSSLPVGAQLQVDWVQKELKDWKYAYDARDTDHYDCISAFIKSVRGSDPDAALYWLARMLQGGEDPLYIARRLIILASEDVGLADSRGLNLASAVYVACEKVGMPECAIPLSHVTLFLALAPKSNSAYSAWDAARSYVDKNPLQPVPEYLREKPSDPSESYLYAHSFDANVTGQKYWNEAEQFYHLKAIGAEQNFLPLYVHRRQLKKQILSSKK